MKKQYKLSANDLSKLQKCELELLVEFDRICRRYNIKYSIDGGTLLGAIRHKGFIPWDDDADVIMMRSEYNKFKKVCEKELDKTKFYLQDMHNTNGYRWGYAKLRRKNTKFIRLNQEMMPYEQGIFMDVFICDSVPEKYIKRMICNFWSFIYRKIFWSSVGKEIESGGKKVILTLLSMIPEKVLKRSYSAFVTRCNKENKNSKWVKCLTFPACNHEYGYKREWYEDTIDIPFENVVLKGSRKWNEYLSFLYGDYMQLPPLDKRKVHPVSEFEVEEDL